jgi:SAM-dependent methyltransferase
MKIQELFESVEDFEFPDPEKSQKTQISGTAPTYTKAKAHLDTHSAHGKVLDFGAGLGHGSHILGADTYEPFPKGKFTPTYAHAADIPNDSYEKVTNFNVLNVVPPKTRKEIVKHIGRVLKSGGIALITTRGRDVLDAKGKPGPEPMSIVTSTGTYQKGFTTKELQQYVESVLGDKFEVSPFKLGPAGVLIKKL